MPSFCRRTKLSHLVVVVDEHALPGIASLEGADTDLQELVERLRGDLLAGVLGAAADILVEAQRQLEIENIDMQLV